MTRLKLWSTSLAALVIAAPVAFAQDKGAEPGAQKPSAGSSQRMDDGAGAKNSEPNRATGADTRSQAGEKPGRENAQERRNTNEQRKDARDEAKENRKDARDDAKEQRKDARDERKEDRKDARDDAADKRDRKPGSEPAKSDDDRPAGEKMRERDERAGSGTRDKTQDKADDKSQRDRNRDTADDERNRQRDPASASDRTQGGADRNKEARGEVREEDRRKVEEVRSKVDDDKRQRVRDLAFRKDVRRASNVDIRVDLGVRLPRSVEVYAIPDDIVEIVPAYRGYRYIVIEDRYVIVDPDTYVVVDVIDRGGGGPRGEYAYRSDGTARLDLTHDQIEIIRREVRDSRRFDYDGDLEVGIRLPGEIAFEAFPEPVVRDVPVIRNYRYAVVEDEIAIVAPDAPEVVFVIGD